MDTIDFVQIRKDIAGRINKISSLRQEIGQYVVFDEFFNVQIDPDCRTTAKKAMDEITQLKKSNQKDGCFLEFVKTIVEKYRLNTQNDIHGGIEMLDIGSIIARERRSSALQIEDLKQEFLSSGITAADFEKQKSNIERPHEKRIGELRQALEELEAYIKSNQ